MLNVYEGRLGEIISHPRLNRGVSYKTLIWTDIYSLKKHISTGESYRPTEHWW
jgi:CRISPR-associated protein Cas1